MATLTEVPRRQYRARPGASFGDKKAAEYGKFLERKAGLGKRLVSPEKVVQLAQPENSPIHEQFTWDDSEAAHEWRIREAQHLIGHIVYVTGYDDEGKEETSRAFLNVTTSNGHTERGYVSDQVVWARPELAEQVVAKAMRELDGWRDRYKAYSELASAVAKVEEALEEAA